MKRWMLLLISVPVFAAETTLTSVTNTSPFALQSENTCDATIGSDTVTGCADTSWLQPGMLVDLSGSFPDLTDIIVQSVTATTVQFEVTANATTSNITITQNLYYSPSVQATDVVVFDALNSISGTMNVQLDGDVDCATTCSGYWSLNYSIAGVTSGTDVMHFNSTAPSWQDTLEPLILFKDEAITPIDIGSLCIDPDGQAIAVEVRMGTLPTGLSLSAPGVLSGTPTATANETLNLTCKDTGDLYAAQDQAIRVIDKVVVTGRRLAE